MPDTFDGLDLTPEQQRELATLRRGFALFNEILDDPEVGTPLKRKLEQKDPNLKFKYVEDIAAPIIKPIQDKLAALETDQTETLKKIDEGKTAIETIINDFKKERADERDVNDLKSKIEAAKRHYRFTDEGVAALIEHMRATNTGDPMTAGAFLVQNMERPEPVTSNGLAPEQARRNGAPDVDLFRVPSADDDSMKLLHSGPKGAEKWMQQEIDKIIAETAEAA